MPWIDEPIAPQPIMPTGTTAPNPIRPNFGQVLEAAFEQENPLVSVARRLWAGNYPAVAGHNPLSTIAGTEFEERFADRFIGSQSPDEDFAIIGRIHEEQENDRMLDAAGFGGTVARITAGTLSPELALPGGFLVKGVRGGYSLAKSAAVVGASAAGATVVSEAALQATHETRTLGESMANVASAAVLGGIIGSGAAALLTRGERNAMSQILDRERVATDAHANGLPAPPQVRPSDDGFNAFHGSPHDFDAFDVARTNEGVWLTQDADHARRYAIGDGTLYNVRVKGSPEDFIVRDAPIDQQSAAVRQAIEQIQSSVGLPPLSAGSTGQAFYSALAKHLAGPEGQNLEGTRKANEILAQHNVPGIKNDGAFVVFDDKVLEIVDKNGKPVQRAAFEFSPEDSAKLDEMQVRKSAAYDRAEAAHLAGDQPTFQAAKAELEAVEAEMAPILAKRPTKVSMLETRDGEGNIIQEASLAGPSSAGAAASDARALEPVSYGLDKIPGWSRIARFIGTDLGIYSSASTVARRHFSGLAETTLRFEQNLERTVTRPDGTTYTIAPQVTSNVIPLSREVSVHAEQIKVQVSDELKRLYSEYFFGGETTAPYLRAEMQTRFGSSDKLSPDEFGREVAAAMHQGDTHALPQVAAAAQFLRRKVFDPWAERMEKANPDFKRHEFSDGQTYFPYRWDNAKIEQERPQFVDNVVLPHLRADQTKKAAAKGRLNTLNDELQGFETAIAKAGNEEDAAALMLRRDEVRARIEAEIAAWEGKSVTEAKAAIRAREKYEAERQARAADKGAEPPTARLASADGAIDRAVKRIIESDRDLDDLDLRAKAEEIADHVLGTPIGRIPYDSHTAVNTGPRSAAAVARGPTMARDFAVPYSLAKDWISHDLNEVLAGWTRTMIPDALLFERFPGEGPAMTSLYRSIQDDYANLVRDAKTPKERKRLNDEKDSVIATIDGVVQRVRGVMNNSTGMSGRIGEVVRRTNQMADLGFAAVTSITDFAGPVFHHGLMNTFRDGWVPYMSHLTGGDMAKMSKKELRAMGIGLEIENSTRGHALAEISEAYHPRTPAERALKFASDRFFLLNLQAQETALAKRIAGRVTMSQMLDAIRAEAAGKISKRQASLLRESNIDESMSARIWKQFEGPDGGSTIDGALLPNTAAWTDEQARLFFTAAVARDVDRAVITPGADKPLWLSTNAGSLLGQYKSFSMASTTRILISGIQRADGRVLQGSLSAVALGAMAFQIGNTIRGREPPKRPQDFIKEAVSRSGLLGIFEDVNLFAAKASRGSVDVYRLIGADKPLSRNTNRTIASALLGPTAGKIEALARVTGAAASGDWNGNDTHALRRLIATQNVFYLNGAFEAAEGGFNRMLNIPARAEPEPRR